MTSTARIQVFYDDVSEEPVVEAKLSADTPEGLDLIIQGVFQALMVMAERFIVSEDDTGAILYDSEREGVLN